MKKEKSISQTNIEMEEKPRDEKEDIVRKNRSQCQEASRVTNHIIPFSDAADYIRIFQRKKFPDLDFYGGTIYRDRENFPADGYSVIRFHYCSNPNDDDKIFAAFELENCERDDEVLGDCLISADALFPKINPKFPYSFNEALWNFNLPSTSGNQRMPQNNVINSRICFARTNNPHQFYGHLGDRFGDGYTGYFNYAATVRAMFREEGCAGIRYFFGYADYDRDGNKLDNRIRLILVGVDEDGNNLKTYRETSVPFSKLLF